MHSNDNELRAFVDGELSHVDRERVQQHTSGCEICQARLSVLREDSVLLDEKMNLLAPGAAQRPNAEQAFARLQTRVRAGNRGSIGEIMFDRLGLSRAWQRALGGLVAVLAVVVLLSLAPVRAAASDFLSIFRLNDIVVLPVDLEQIDQLEEVAQNLGDGFLPGAMNIVGELGEPQYVDSIEEASEVAGFSVRAPATHGTAQEIVLRDELTARFVPDLLLVQTLFEAADLSSDLVPPEIDGQPFTITMQPSVVQIWDDSGLLVVQMDSPIVEIPDGVDEQALGNAMLQLLGYSADEAVALSASIDWTTSLLLPLPSHLVDFDEVAVDGTNGFFLTGASPEGDTDFGDYSAVLWQKDGTIYLVAGGDEQARLLEIADSLQ